jgi:hypothetical protein
VKQNKRSIIRQMISLHTLGLTFGVIYSFVFLTGSSASFAAGAGGKDPSRPESLRAAQTAEIARDAAKDAQRSFERDTHLRLTSIVTRKLSRLPELLLSQAERALLIKLLATEANVYELNQILDNKDFSSKEKANQIRSKIAPSQKVKSKQFELDSGVLYYIKGDKRKSIIVSNVRHFETIGQFLIVMMYSGKVSISAINDPNLSTWNIKFIRSIAILGNTLYLQQIFSQNGPSFIRVLAFDSSGEMNQKIVNTSQLPNGDINSISTVTYRDGTVQIELATPPPIPRSSPTSSSVTTAPWVTIVAPIDGGDAAVVNNSRNRSDILSIQTISIP